MPAIDFSAVKNQICIAQVLELIDYEPSRQRGDQLRGPCPIHGSTTPRSMIFAVNLRKNVFHCFKCGAGGNQLDLWMALTDASVYAAAADLCQRLAVDVPTTDKP